MWFREFEIAIIEKDTQKLEELVEAPMQFANVDEMRRAAYLMEEALLLLHELKSQTKQTIMQLKKNIDFLKATQEKTPSQFDIRS